MSTLAKVLLAFDLRYPGGVDVPMEVPSRTWQKWMELARREAKAPGVTAAAALESLSHSPRCLCDACRARRAADLVPVEPTQLDTSGQREPERAAEGVTDSGAAAAVSERSKAAVEDPGPAAGVHDPNTCACQLCLAMRGTLAHEWTERGGSR